MAKNEAKVKFLAETQDFRKNVTEANSSLSELRSELKLNAEQMKTNGETVDALAERHELLEKELKQAEAKTENLAAQMEACTRLYGDNSAEAQKLATQINNAKIAEEKIKQEIAACNEAITSQTKTAKKADNVLETLEKTISEQEDTVKDLKKEYANAVLEFGETSDKAQSLKSQIETLSGKLNKNRADMKAAEDAADSLGKAFDDVGDNADDNVSAFDALKDAIEEQEAALTDLKKEYADAALEYGTNSKEARTLARQISDLSGELNDNRGKMSRVESAADNLAAEVDDAGDAARDAGDGFSVWKGTLADLASSGIQAVLSGVQGLASSFWNLGDETRELRTNLGKVEVAFSDSGLTAEQASSTYEDFYGIVADEGQATEAVSHLAKICDSQEDLTDWTTIATGVYGTFGDSLPLEGLTEAANETVKVGKVTGSLADALNWSTMSSEDWQTAFNGHPKALKKFQSAMKQGLSVEDAFNEALTKCTTESEREQVIRLYGDAAAAYEETNGSIMDANKAQAEYNTALASLGEIVEPIKTAFMEGMASMLQSVSEFISGLDMDAIKSGIETAFGYISDTVFPAIKTGIQWFIDNKDLVVAGLSAIVAGMLAFKVVTIIQTAVGIFKAFQAATTGLTLAQKLLNIVMMANPIAIIVALIVGLVAAFVVLWKKCDWFRNFWIGLWEKIKTAAGVVVDALKQFFTVTIPQAWDTFKGYCATLWDAVKNLVANAWNGIKSGVSTAISAVKNIVVTVFNAVKTFISNVWNGIKTVISTVWNGIKSGVSSAISTVRNVITTVFNAVKSFVSSVWNGIKTTITTVWNGIKTGVSTAVTTVRTVVSNVFNSVRSTVSNIWNGIKSTITNVWTGIKTGVSTAVNNVRSTIVRVFNTIKSTVSRIWNNIKSAIEDPINTAKETISNVVGKIKDALDFDWSIPKPKLPHFKVSGGEAPWGFMGKGSLPKVSVEWYAKGAILNAPTLFGVGKNGNLMGGGEAGAEAVAPIDVLLGYVRQAVQEVVGAMMTVNVDNADSALSFIDSLENHLSTNGGEMGRLIDAIEDLANRPVDLNIDGMRFATATAGASDSVSGNRLNLRTRGLVLP